MLNSISTMNSYYSMYRYGSASAVSSVQKVQRQPVQDAEQLSSPQAKQAVSQAVSADAASGSRPALFWGGRLYLTTPAAEGASASGFMQAGASPEELAVRMRIQYPDQASDDSKKLGEEEKCQTCENRKYQDGSDDMGVSFQTPTRVAPEAAASAVRGHEQEHVVREQAKAEREGRRVVSQDVTLHTGICPECGEVYISGGTTKTVTAAESKPQTEDSAANNSGQEQAVRQPFQAVA